MNLTFDVTNQRLMRTDNNKTVEKSQNYLSCKFNFISSDWDGMTKAVLFKNTDMENPVIRILEDDTCQFPNGVPIGSCNIAVVGGGVEDITNIAENKAITQTGVMITTNTVCIPFDDTLDADNITDWSNPDSGFADFLNMLKKHSSSAVIDHADGSVTENKLAKALRDKIDSKQDKLITETTEKTGDTITTPGIYKMKVSQKFSELDVYWNYLIVLRGSFGQGNMIWQYYIQADNIKCRYAGMNSDGTVRSWGKWIGFINDIQFERFKEDVGILTDLNTTDTTDIVSAINSLVSAFDEKQDKLTFDNEPTYNSDNPITSGVVYDELELIRHGISDNMNTIGNEIGAIQSSLDDKVDKIDGKGLSANDYTNEEKSKLTDLPTKTELDGNFEEKQDKLTFDEYPTEDSDNPVTSGGVKSMVNELQTQINALHGFGADFWAAFFKTGRTDFSYAFINNGAAEIKPTRVINATIIKYMLLNCSELADASPIVVNLTADNPVVIGICMGCLKMTNPPVINFTGENAHVCRSYVAAYANCVKLTRCVIWFGDGTQSASGDRTDMANTFLNCSALASLTFTGSGSPKSLDLSACTLLSNESIQSLYNALMDVSTVTNGTYKITINSEIQTKITALSLDFSLKGWTLEVKQEETENA